MLLWPFRSGKSTWNLFYTYYSKYLEEGTTLLLTAVRKTFTWCKLSWTWNIRSNFVFTMSFISHLASSYLSSVYRIEKLWRRECDKLLTDNRTKFNKSYLEKNISHIILCFMYFLFLCFIYFYSRIYVLNIPIYTMLELIARIMMAINKREKCRTPYTAFVFIVKRLSCRSCNYKHIPSLE